MAGDTNEGATSKSSSYADRLKTNIKYDQRLKRNVLEINIEKNASESEMVLDQNVIAKLMKALKMDISSEMEGYQSKMTKSGAVVSVWCKQGVNLEKFCRNEKIIIANGVYTGSIYPAGRRDVTVKVSGLNWNTPDSLVFEYITKFGGQMASTEVIYDTFADGPLRGKKTGDRRYQVVFNGVQMGTYHFLDGEKVKVYYRGNKKTCGHCHSTPETCKGVGTAKICKEKGGVRVDLAEHMRNVWNKIKFAPTSFKLPDFVDEDLESDMKIRKESFFIPPINKPSVSEAELEKVAGFEVRNFPESVKNEEAKSFIESKFEKKVEFEDISYERVKNKLNVKVGSGSKLTGNEIQEFIDKIQYTISKQKHFGNPLYCRLLRNMSPVKENEKNMETKKSKVLRTPILTMGSVTGKRDSKELGSPSSPELNPQLKKQNLL